MRLNRPQFVFPADLRHYYFHPKKKYLRRIDTSRLRSFFPILRDRYRVQPDWSIPVLEHWKARRTLGYRRRAKLLRLRRLASNRIAAAQNSMGFHQLPPATMGRPLKWKARKRLGKAKRGHPRHLYPFTELLIRKKNRKRKMTMLGYRLGTRPRFKKSLAVLRNKRSILRPDAHADDLFSGSDVGLLSASRRYLPEASAILPSDLRRSWALRPLHRLSRTVRTSFLRHRRPANLNPREMNKREYCYRHTRRRVGLTNRTDAFELPRPIGKHGTFKHHRKTMSRKRKRYRTSLFLSLNRSRRFMPVDRDHGAQLPAWSNPRFRRKKHISLRGMGAPRRRRRRSRTMRTRRLEADVTDPASPAWPVPSRLAWRRRGVKKPRALEPAVPVLPGQGTSPPFSYSELAGYWESVQALMGIPGAVPPKIGSGSGDLFQTPAPLPLRRLPRWASGARARRSRPSVTYGQAAKGAFKSRGVQGRRKINRYGNSSSFGSPRLGHALSLLPSILEQVLVGAASCWTELVYDLWWVFSEAAILATQPSLSILPYSLAGAGVFAWFALCLVDSLSLMALDAAGALGFLADLVSHIPALVDLHQVSPSPYPSEKINRGSY